MVDIRLARLPQTVAQDADLAVRRGGIDVGENFFFDLLFDRVGQLVALFVEDLDAVVLVRVVRGGDHDARIRAFEHGQVRDRRSRQHTERHHVAADGADARDQRTFEHIGRNARVLADGDDRLSALFFLQNGRDGLARTERKISREIFSHNAANAVGAKQFSHDFDSSSQKDLKFCRKVVCIYRLSCSGTSSMLFGTERPKCSYALRVTQRPRGVRCKKPSCIRYGS